MIGRRILIVDDDQQMVRTLADIFRLRGWEAAGAFSGEEAVEAVRIRPVDVVLMDILMPGMTGVEALREVRASNPELHVVLMTAHSGSELIEQAERSGAARVLSKPVVIPELLSFLEVQRPPGRFVVVLDGEDAELAGMLETTLGPHGHTVCHAETLQFALEALDLRAAGVVVMNLPLDGLQPEESVRAIRRVNASVILILCSRIPALLDETANSIPPEWIRARLLKPFPPERLLEVLDAL